MNDTLKVFLKDVSLFSGLSEDELNVLTQVATEVEYAKGSPIVLQDAPGALLIVYSGEVSIVLERPSGEPVHVSTFRRGDFFGEMSEDSQHQRSPAAVAPLVAPGPVT
jgi:CRP-like cAMP-binding protein